jgi:hypothetical protein
MSSEKKPMCGESINLQMQVKTDEKRRKGNRGTHQQTHSTHHHSVCTTMAVSSIHATSMSRVNTRETLYRSSPPSARRSNRRAILSGRSFAPAPPPAPPANGCDTIDCAQLATIRCCPSPVHRSENPSDDRIRKRGLHEGLSSSRRCVTSGRAVIYGGVRLRTRNSSHGEVL